MHMRDGQNEGEGQEDKEGGRKGVLGSSNQAGEGDSAGAGAPEEQEGHKDEGDNAGAGALTERDSQNEADQDTGSSSSSAGVSSPAAGAAGSASAVAGEEVKGKQNVKLTKMSSMVKAIMEGKGNGDYELDDAAFRGNDSLKEMIIGGFSAPVVVDSQEVDSALTVHDGGLNIRHVMMPASHPLLGPGGPTECWLYDNVVFEEKSLQQGAQVRVKGVEGVFVLISGVAFGGSHDILHRTAVGDTKITVKSTAAVVAKWEYIAGGYPPFTMGIVPSINALMPVPSSEVTGDNDVLKRVRKMSALYRKFLNQEALRATSGRSIVPPETEPVATRGGRLRKSPVKLEDEQAEALKLAEELKADKIKADRELRQKEAEQERRKAAAQAAREQKKKKAEQIDRERKQVAAAKGEAKKKAKSGRGRPPVGGTAMSGAARQQKLRERRRDQSEDEDNQSDEPEHDDKAMAAIGKLQADLNTLLHGGVREQESKRKKSKGKGKRKKSKGGMQQGGMGMGMGMGIGGVMPCMVGMVGMGGMGMSGRGWP